MTFNTVINDDDLTLDLPTNNAGKCPILESLKAYCFSFRVINSDGQNNVINLDV